jgi:hypothetical protein
MQTSNDSDKLPEGRKIYLGITTGFAKAKNQFPKYNDDLASASYYLTSSRLSPSRGT